VSGKFVYVAGPLTKGDQLLNVRNAVLVGERLRAAGMHPFVPHLSALWHMITPVEYEGWMTLDFAWIEHCDALLRIPGESSGADREVVHAFARGIPVFLDEGELIAWAQGIDARHGDDGNGGHG
jgi:hypothetical protein